MTQMDQLPDLLPATFAAKRQGIQGTVLINGLIDKEGRLTDLRVLAGPKLLQQPALNAVRQWICKPYISDGQPVEVETNLTIKFNLGR